MNTYVIERTVPGAGGMDAEGLQAISQKSNGVLADLGEGITWLHSYVVDDKILCVYQARNEDLIREHGRRGGFPVDSISVVRATISPATADGGAS